MPAESAEWAKTPAAAWDYYNSLTFTEQCALAWVINRQRELVQEHAEDVRAELVRRYENAR